MNSVDNPEIFNYTTHGGCQLKCTMIELRGCAIWNILKYWIYSKYIKILENLCCLTSLTHQLSHKSQSQWLAELPTAGSNLNHRFKVKDLGRILIGVGCSSANSQIHKIRSLRSQLLVEYCWSWMLDIDIQCGLF